MTTTLPTVSQVRVQAKALDWIDNRKYVRWLTPEGNENEGTLRGFWPTQGRMTETPFVELVVRVTSRMGLEIEMPVKEMLDLIDRNMMATIR